MQGKNFFGRYREKRKVDLYAGDTVLQVEGEIRGIRGPFKYGRRRHWVDIAVIPLQNLTEEFLIQYKGKQCRVSSVSFLVHWNKLFLKCHCPALVMAMMSFYICLFMRSASVILQVLQGQQTDKLSSIRQGIGF